MAKEKKRVVITGMGVISSLGNDVDLFYQNLLEGKSGVGMIESFPCDQFPTKFAGCVKDFQPEDYMDKKQARRVDLAIAFAIAATQKALAYGAIDASAIEKLDKSRCGVIIGSGMGGMQVYSDGVQTLLEKGPSRLTPFFVPYILTNMPGALVAMEYGFMGPNYSISTACATGNNSIIAAAQTIERGDADFMVTGGTEKAIIPVGLAGFCACKALSQRNDDPQGASRPWDKERDGFVMGEGAGVLILEELGHALKRGAKILAEYKGGGLSCDAHHITEPKPDGSGVALCLQNALHDANLAPSDINYINAHATSTPAGDMAEIRALQKVFPNPQEISINATKSMIGHCLGAAGGIEAIATVKAIMEGEVHPTINLNQPEEILFHAPKQAEKLKIQAALSNSFGFGGHNATIVFAPYTPR
ncbi:MAG: beta-ketoacyl-ACP synthase II [Parachlamydiaceae bacterium]